MKHKVWILVTAFLMGSPLQAANLVERIIEVQTHEKNPAAARTILMNAAAERGSEELLKEMIGEAKLARNRTLIQTKIIKKSASYLPFAKAGELKPTDDGFSMIVTLHANLDDLQRLLLENGLFYDADATPTVLPVVKWVDRAGSRSFGWWMGASDPTKLFLAKESRFLESELRDAFLKSGFYVLRPQALHYEDLLGPEGRNENLMPQEIAGWARALNAQIAIQGQVQISKGERPESAMVDLRLTALQLSNERVVGEVARQFETEPGAFEVVVDRKMKEITQGLAADLAAQMLEVWKQGAINSQLYRLKVLGRLSLPAQESLKTLLRNKVHEIKSVRERLIEADQIVYELDSSVGPAEIAKKLSDFEVQGTRFSVEQANEKDLVLRIKK